MQTDKKVVLGEVADVLLWGFKLALIDRRTNQNCDGYAIETGNDEYDLDDAVARIKQRYGAMGYSVIYCDFDEERHYLYDAVNEFESAEPTDSGRVPEHKEDEDGDSYSDEIAAAMAELDD